MWVLLVAAACPPDGWVAAFNDMHDGDQKTVRIDGASLEIRPSENNQTWVVTAPFDRESCSALVDFDVPGKPSPPPVKLEAVLAPLGVGPKQTIIFRDPSGKIAAPTIPLNGWVERRDDAAKFAPFDCVNHDLIYADMHDGDMKHVEVKMGDGNGGVMTITPHGNNQTWVVKATVYPATCSAEVDFRVPGKPSPPGAPLIATLVSAGMEPGYLEDRMVVVFSSLDLGPGFLNEWVSVPASAEAAELLV